MRLTDEHITQFQAIYKERFGREISREIAHEQGIKLVRLMSLIYKPMTGEEQDKVRERKEKLES